MKILIICFSQTGNTRKVAEAIRAGIIEVVGQCDLVTLQEAETGLPSEYDLVGLGCPVYYFKEPFHVGDFIEDLPPQDGRYWFAFCSHGSAMGQTLFSMTGRLERKGARVIGGHHTYADATVPFYPHPTLTTGHPDEQDLREARDFGKAIAECSRAVSAGDSRCIEKPAPAPEEWARNEAAMLSRELLGQVLPCLSIKTETCTRCGLCRDICPVEGIDPEADPPRIQEPCVYCFQCACVCPTCSIEADWRTLVNMAPDNYARYRKSLDAAAGRGEFRWLVDPDTIDCGDPLYRQRQRELEDEQKSSE